MFDDKVKKFLLLLARTSVESHLNNKKISEMNFNNIPSILKKKLPLFVTIYKGKFIKGSMGFFPVITLPIYKAVQEAAILAATRDPRYPSIRSYELSEIIFEISIIKSFFPLNSYREYKKEYGIFLKYEDQIGIILPQIAKRYNWQEEGILKEACLKANLPPEFYKSKNVSLTALEVESFSEYGFEKQIEE